VAVPVLVSLTDRLPAKRVYLLSVLLTAAAHFGYAYLAEGFWSALGFRALAGIGWAGTYMVGLKALTDRVEGPQQSRAVAAHAASIGISGAVSFLFAAAVAALWDWRMALALSGAAALVAFALMAAGLPGGRAAAPRPAGRLLDFRPVLRNRSAMAYALGYCVHTWEMSALRQWGVTFLAFALALDGGEAGLLGPATVVGAMGLVGVATSMLGNEAARRFGRRRFILAVMLAGMGVALGVGFSAALSYALAAVAVLTYAALIWADSSSLTAGAAGSALPGQRGATLAVHSTLGYAGGFFGPLVVGIVLDLAGTGVVGWGLAFAHLALVTAVGPAALLLLRPAGLAGDRDAPPSVPLDARAH
jgi:predicted MFS family arabinose efflux permease